MQYFHISEQVETAVAVDAEIENGKCVSAGGVIMQLLPGCSEENMDRAEEQMQAFVDVASVIEKLGADKIMEKFSAKRQNILMSISPNISAAVRGKNSNGSFSLSEKKSFTKL